MNYEKIYDSLISRAKSENRSKLGESYYEWHHIVPRSMNGTNQKENLVLLSAREHFIAHWLLWRIHRNRQMATAFFAMCKLRNKDRSNHVKISSRSYEEAKLAFLQNRRSVIIAANQKRKGGKHRGKYEVTVRKEGEILCQGSMSDAYSKLVSLGVSSKKLWEGLRAENVPGYTIEVKKLERVSATHEYRYVKKVKPVFADYDWEAIKARYAECKKWKQVVKEFSITQSVNIEAWEKRVVTKC